MHSKKIGTLFSIGLTQRFLVRFMTPKRFDRRMGEEVKSFFNKADIAAALDASHANLGKIVGVRAETHIFVQVMR